jgi:predicted CopG family antitoxin
MTKVISLSEKAYHILKKLKRGRESFSDVVIRITKDAEPNPLINFAGRWAGDDANEVSQILMREREAASTREHVI